MRLQKTTSWKFAEKMRTAVFSPRTYLAQKRAYKLQLDNLANEIKRLNRSLYKHPEITGFGDETQRRKKQIRAELSNVDIVRLRRIITSLEEERAALETAMNELEIQKMRHITTTRD